MLHAVVCYDVMDDARRARLCAGLKAFLEHVQLSVFEGSLSPRSHAAMLRLIDETIDPEEDDVRVYRLCPGCRGEVDLFGRAVQVQTEPEDVVVG